MNPSIPTMADHGCGLEPTCPECGDQAFFVDNAEPNKPDAFAFSCDSCDYIYELGDFPETDAALLALARSIRMR